MLSIAAALVAYLIGSISFAIVVSKAMGLNDPRSYGSGNPGATNVLRTGNKKAAVLTLLGDAVKGVIPVVAVRLLAPRLGFGDETVAAVALAVFLGHLWPVFFRFQGGKGVATALGVLLALDPWLGLACLATWIAVALIGRISSLAALTAAALSPLYCWLLLPQPIYTFTVTAIAALLILRHRKNIIGLLNGTESRFGKKKDGAA